MPGTALLPLSSPGEVAPAGLNRVLHLVARVEDYGVASLHPEPDGGWSLALGKARLTWSADGAAVTKTLVPHLVIPHWAALLGTPRRAALNELRVNRLLSEQPPPVPVPMLLSSSRRGPSMTFEAVDGAPLGPKFPSSLPGSTVDAAFLDPSDGTAGLSAQAAGGSAGSTYRPTAGGFTAFPASSRTPTLRR